MLDRCSIYVSMNKLQILNTKILNTGNKHEASGREIISVISLIPSSSIEFFFFQDQQISLLP